MHIHILGVCGTFMGGIAAIARESGHRVTGCDQNVYPPMSTQLESQGIELIADYSSEQIKLKPDIFVIGNVVSRGNPLMEEILSQNLPYISGPQWLSDNILRNRWVIAVSGTHGKTTTSSMLAWILDYAGMNPGFLIGGIPENFGLSARIGSTLSLNSHSSLDTANVSPFFVIEADEYDTAFFDKRSKFLHYRPRTVILNNLEFDHSDIFPDLSAIKQQFHHFIRIIPNNGLIVSNGTDENLQYVLKQGCWTPIEEFGTETGWHSELRKASNGINIYFNKTYQGYLQWPLLGDHNRMNALAALAAARHAGVPPEQGIVALSQFKNVKRRMEICGIVSNITVYDDFAHHPTAIHATLNGLRAHVGEKRIIAVLEPRSNTMKMGVWEDRLAGSLLEADQVFFYTRDVQWAETTLDSFGKKAHYYDDLNQLIRNICLITKSGDHILIMSNGGFGDIHKKILSDLQNR